MKTKFKVHELLSQWDSITSPTQQAEILSKDAGAESLAFHLMGLREYYPTASGKTFPDFTDRYGRLTQVKGSNGGFNATGDLIETIKADRATHFFIIGKPNKHGLHWYLIEKTSLISIADRIFRLSQGRFRLTELMKHHGRLTACSKHSGIVESNEYSTIFTESMLSLERAKEEGRIR